jgi:hypothetical protein
LGPDDHVDGRTVGAKLRAHTDPEKTVLITDESGIYTQTGKVFLEHQTVNHKKKQYVRYDQHGHQITTNTAEGLFANLKRQITGTHHHTSKRHLPKYVAEYDYKYNSRDDDDGTRTVAAIRGGEGKRLTLFKSKTGNAESLIDEDLPRATPRKASRSRSAPATPKAKAKSKPKPKAKATAAKKRAK